MGKRYPMINGIEDDYIHEFGGKFSILEAIARDCSVISVPVFAMIERDKPHLPLFGAQVLRTSSNLDILGVFGLTESIYDVINYGVSDPSGFSESGALIKRIMQSDSSHESSLNHTRLTQFASTRGLDAGPLRVFAQKQVECNYWALVMEHPNNEGVFLVNVSTTPSYETFRNIGASSIFLTGVSHSRCNWGGYYSLDDGLVGEFPPGSQEFIEKAVFDHMVIYDLDIVSTSWASIAEMGFSNDGVSLFQYTPVHRKDGTHDINYSKIIIGSLPQQRLPIVRLPSLREVFAYDGVGLDEFPDFKEHADSFLERQCLAKEYIFWSYMKGIGDRYPDGYIVLADLAADSKIEFDITMGGCKAALLRGDPKRALCHSASRLMYGCSVVVVDKDLPSDLKTGAIVNFGCDGSSYTIS